MLEIFFTTLLEISLATSIVILLLKLLSAFLNKNMAAKWKYWIWLVLAMRLIIPFNFSLTATPVKVSIPDMQMSNVVNFTPTRTIEASIPDVPISAVTDSTPTQTITNTNTMPNQAKITAQQDGVGIVPNDAKNSPTLIETAIIIWLLGCCGFMAYQFAGYRIFKKKAMRWSKAPADPQIAAALHSTASEMGITRNVTALISDSVASPLMIGFIKPKLFLPREDYSNTDLSFILRHELTHCKRNDLWYKLLLVFANAVHWFNPLVWLMFREASTDLELSCDDEVTRGISFEGRKAYSETILESIGGQKMRQTALTTYFNGGKGTLKNRFINILNMKRKKNGAPVLLIVVLVVGILGGLVACTTGNANQNNDAEPSAAAADLAGGVWELVYKDYNRQFVDIAPVLPLPKFEGKTQEEWNAYAESIGKTRLEGWSLIWAQGVTLSPDGNTAVYYSNKDCIDGDPRGQSVFVFDQNTGEERILLKSENGTAYNFYDWLDNSTLLCSATDKEGKLSYLVCTLSGNVTPIDWQGEQPNVYAAKGRYVAYQPVGNGHTLVFGQFGGDNQWVELNTLETTDGYPINAGSISPDGSLLAFPMRVEDPMSAARTMTIWNTATGKLTPLPDPEIKDMAAPHASVPVKSGELFFEVVYGGTGTDGNGREQLWRYTLPEAAKK